MKIDSQHPFGNQATAHSNDEFLKLGSARVEDTALRGRPFGFAPQSCDWFAFIEDDDAAGPLVRDYCLASREPGFNLTTEKSCQAKA